MKKAVIFDIDGTLANIDHRLHLIKDNSAANWNEFFREAANDAPIGPMVWLARGLSALSEDEPFEVLYCTGRPEYLRDITRNWLREQGLPVADYQLFMRASKDFRDDNIVKEELLQKIRNAGYDPFLVFDDRKRVVDMWRENGILTLQPVDGNY